MKRSILLATVATITLFGASADDILDWARLDQKNVANYDTDLFHCDGRLQVVGNTISCDGSISQKMNMGSGSVTECRSDFLNRRRDLGKRIAMVLSGEGDYNLLPYVDEWGAQLRLLDQLDCPSGVQPDPELMSVSYHLSDDGILDKPLIVVEGYDPDEEMGHDRIYEMLGEEVHALRQVGIDIVTVNFPVTRRYLDGGIEGAYSKDLSYLIESLRKRKSGPYKMVLVGASMGGLVAHQALLDLESRHLSHGVGLFIAYDSPYNGAYFPKDIEAMLRDLLHRIKHSICYKVGVALNIKRGQIHRGRSLLYTNLYKMTNHTAQEMLEPDGNHLPYRYRMPRQDGIINVAFSNGKNRPNDGIIEGDGAPQTLYKVRVTLPNYRDFCTRSRDLTYEIVRRPGSLSTRPGCQAGIYNVHRSLAQTLAGFGELIDYDPSSELLNYTFVPTDSALNKQWMRTGKARRHTFFAPRYRYVYRSPFDVTFTVPDEMPDEHHIQFVGSANEEVLVAMVKDFYAGRIRKTGNYANLHDRYAALRQRGGAVKVELHVKKEFNDRYAALQRRGGAVKVELHVKKAHKDELRAGEIVKSSRHAHTAARSKAVAGKAHQGFFHRLFASLRRFIFG